MKHSLSSPEKAWWTDATLRQDPIFDGTLFSMGWWGKGAVRGLASTLARLAGRPSMSGQVKMTMQARASDQRLDFRSLPTHLLHVLFDSDHWLPA